MRAWRLSEPGKVSLDEMESQPVGPNCVKVKLMYCSVAITDRLLALGKLAAEYPLVLGRQAVGMVVETGEDVKNFARGDTVAIKPLAVCSACQKCAEYKYAECENMLVFGMNEDGFLRDFAVLSSADIVKLPERVSVRDAAFLDYIDIAIETMSRLNIDKGQYLVICGATQLGIIMAQVAMYYQIVPILADIDAEYLQTAAKLGVYYTIDSSETDTKKKIFTLTGGKMADAAAYMSDGSYPFGQAADYVKKGGHIAICGLEKSRLELSANYTAILNRHLTVCGVSESNKNITSAINMLANKTVSVAPLISTEIPFEDAGAELLKPVESHDVYFRTLVKM